MALLPVDEALARILYDAAHLPPETVAIGDAAWRVLAADLVASRTQPPFDASAMDGYAVRADDIAEAGALLTVIGEAPAGRPFEGSVEAGQAVRIFTGAPVPSGADTILIQENATRVDATTIRATEPTAAGRHIRRRGLDFETGDVVLAAGRLLDPAAISLAAAANHPTVSVVRRPLIAILATGDELVSPGQPLRDGQIIASNSYGVAAAIQASGGRSLDLGIVPDREDAIRNAIQRGVDGGADAIVTLGGASVGDHDLMHRVLGQMGMTPDFWKIAMRPGKPLMSGRLENVRVLGLPGNPVASLVCATVFLKPLVAALAGLPHAAAVVRARLDGALPSNDLRQDYIRCRLDRDVDGRWSARAFTVQDSSMLRTLAQADGLLVRAPFAPAAEPGTGCDVILLRDSTPVAC